MDKTFEYEFTAGYFLHSCNRDQISPRLSDRPIRQHDLAHKLKQSDHCLSVRFTQAIAAQISKEKLKRY